MKRLKSADFLQKNKELDDFMKEMENHSENFEKLKKKHIRNRSQDSQEKFNKSLDLKLEKLS